MDVKPLWMHQKEMIRRALPLRWFGLFADPGCGKTRVAIELLRRWSTVEERLLRTLYLGPPIIVQNVKREIVMFSKSGSQVVCLEGTGKQRAELVEKYKDQPGGTIFVTNYESTLMPEVFEKLMRWQPEVLICDESHKLKNLSAKRTKLVIKLADVARYKLIMTGTPVLNSPLDLFSQFRIMDGGETFGKNYFVFRATYFQDKNAAMPKSKYFPNWVPKVGALEALHAKISSLSMVAKKDTCLDLPQLLLQTVFVDLSKEQAKLYEAMKRDFIAYLNGKAVVANLAITKALRLQQIVSGFVALEGDEGEERTNVRLKENPRGEALRELLSSIAPHHKILVWAVFRENYVTIRRICEDLELGFVEVYGGVSAKDKQDAVDRFNIDPTCRVFIGHPASGGVGVNLTSASYCIFYSRTFSLENDTQAEARCYRGGSEIHEKITRIDLVARGTIDELIAERLAQKQAVSDAILLDLGKSL